MDEATWAALAAALTIAGLIWTVLAFRRRGAGTGLRALGFTLLPVAAWLTGTLELATDVGSAVIEWAAGLALNPVTWTGIALAALAVLCFVVGGFLRDRQLARGQGADPGRLRRGGTPAPGPVVTPADRQDDEIEEILRRRGIS